MAISLWPSKIVHVVYCLKESILKCLSFVFKSKPLKSLDILNRNDTWLFLETGLFVVTA